MGTYWPGEFIFQCPIFLPFHTVHGVLKARILKWFAIPFSSKPHFVRTLHNDLSVLGGPTCMVHSFIELDKARHPGMWSPVGLRKHHYEQSYGGDGILVELFKSWKMMLWKCCTQYASKFGKLSSGHRTGKGHFSFQSQRKAMPKNAQTTAQLHSSHMRVK